MNNQNMSAGKVAAISFGVGAMFVLDPLDSGGGGYSVWRDWAVVCIIAGVALLAVGWLYRLLFSPLELLRAPDDVGYIAADGRSKAEAANDVRRRRKTGDLPPVYPNGWYRVLDSHLLERGEVKQVSILGMLSCIVST